MKLLNLNARRLLLVSLAVNVLLVVTLVGLLVFTPRPSKPPRLFGAPPASSAFRAGPDLNLSPQAQATLDILRESSQSRREELREEREEVEASLHELATQIADEGWDELYREELLFLLERRLELALEYRSLYETNLLDALDGFSPEVIEELYPLLLERPPSQA